MKHRGYKLTPSGKLLHRQLYLKYFGNIPKGYIIRHLDGVKTNNNIENLIALPQSFNSKLLQITRDTGKMFSRNEILILLNKI